MTETPKSGDIFQLPPSSKRPQNNNVENNPQDEEKVQADNDVSAFKALGWLDRFLAVWILLAMIIGILLGNFVPSTGPALEKGKFVGVSVPIGMNSSPWKRHI